MSTIFASLLLVLVRAIPVLTLLHVVNSSLVWIRHLHALKVALVLISSVVHTPVVSLVLVPILLVEPLLLPVVNRGLLLLVRAKVLPVESAI